MQSIQPSYRPKPKLSKWPKKEDQPLKTVDMDKLNKAQTNALKSTRFQNRSQLAESSRYAYDVGQAPLSVPLSPSRMAGQTQDVRNNPFERNSNKWGSDNTSDFAITFGPI